ncbi:MAG: hypothetical protein JST80_08745 [Bdellovibrionales bacterium]|nr:hypothetical protein [Bdellovibrionales bacterium]
MFSFLAPSSFAQIKKASVKKQAATKKTAPKKNPEPPRIAKFPEFGEEASCTWQRMKYQKDFVKLLKTTMKKPADFGSAEYFADAVGTADPATCQVIPSEKSVKDLTALTDTVKKQAVTSSIQYNLDFDRDIKCILLAQSEFPDKIEAPKNGFFYGACKSAVDPAVQKRSHGYRPCRTLENAELMALSVKLVANCSGLKQSDMFPLLEHEGGFNLNVISSTGAAGMGQLTADAILNVKNGGDTSFKDVDDAITTKKYPSLLPGMSCDILKPYLDEFPTNSKSDCEVMTPPKNPLMSLLISAKLFKQNLALATDTLKDLMKRYPDFAKKFKPEEREKLIRALYLWAYNGGPGTLSNHFEDFIYHIYGEKGSMDLGDPRREPTPLKRHGKIVKDKHGKKVMVTILKYPSKHASEASVDDFIDAFRVHLLRKYPNPKGNPKRSYEVSKYYSAIERQLSKTNEKVGGQCFDSKALMVPSEDGSKDPTINDKNEDPSEQDDQTPSATSPAGANVDPTVRVPKAVMPPPPKKEGNQQ